MNHARLLLQIIKKKILLIIFSIRLNIFCHSRPSQVPKAQSDIFKCLVLPLQQSITQKFTLVVVWKCPCIYRLEKAQQVYLKHSLIEAFRENLFQSRQVHSVLTVHEHAHTQSSRAMLCHQSHLEVFLLMYFSPSLSTASYSCWSFSFIACR